MYNVQKEELLERKKDGMYHFEKKCVYVTIFCQLIGSFPLKYLDSRLYRCESGHEEMVRFEYKLRRDILERVLAACSFILCILACMPPS